MSVRVILALPPDVQTALWWHLLPGGRAPEQAAFVFTEHESGQGLELFRHIEWYPVPPEGFLSRSAFHFELTDATRADVIKRAHDLDASLVEFHSHTGACPAAFSESDLIGFWEFVPHIWWRLKGRPYLAVVVTRSGFDGLAWLKGPALPEPLGGIRVDDNVLTATGLSRWEANADD